MQSALALVDLKHTIMEFAPQVAESVPACEAKRPVSHMLKFLFKLMRESAELEPEIHTQRSRWWGLMSALERVLLFVSEEDGHYAGQMAQAMLLTHDIVSRSRAKFPSGAKGDVAWMHWAAEHGIMSVKECGL